MIKLVNRLGTEKELPVTFYISEMPFDVDLPTQPVYGRSGVVRTGIKTIRDRRFAIEGTLINDARTELDLLMAFLHETPLQCYPNNLNDRFLIVDLVGAPQTLRMRGKEIKVRLQLQALDPLWYGAEKTETITDTKKITVAGTVLTSPLIKTVSATTELNVSNGAQNIKVLAGDAAMIEIDNENYICKVNNVNRPDLINDQWLIDGFHLFPGENTITTNVPIEIIYRSKWY